MPKALTTHFTLDELIASQTAAREGIDNSPDAAGAVSLRENLSIFKGTGYLAGIQSAPAATA